MFLNIPTTTIAFQGGAYGYYVHWVLYSLLTEFDLMSPFRESTSHNRNYLDKSLIDANQVAYTHVDPLKGSTVRLSTNHPVTTFNQVFVKEIEKLSDCIDKVLIPYIDHGTYLLGVHNYLFKIWDDMWTGALAYVDRNDLKHGWGVDITADLSTVQPWILREHHSMNIFDSWENQCGWFAPNYFFKPNCKFIFISDLFYNFLNTIEEIRIFLDVEWKKDPKTLLPYHKQNISNQKYHNQDILVKQILYSITTGQNFTWDNKDLTLYSEAYIQRFLSQQGILLKCNGLNLFPTSTEGLIKVFA